MRFVRCAVVAAALILPALSAWADDDDQPFAEEQQRTEFKQMETKGEMSRVEPRAVIAPGPKGGAEPQLLRDRLQVLRYNRSMAVQQKKPAAEIAALDAQIRDLEQQIAP